jgi:AraC-like DNA-binding protein
MRLSSPCLPCPPPHALRLRTDALEQVREWADSLSGRHSRVVHGTGPLGFDMVVVPGQATDVAWCSVGLPQTLRGALSSPCLHVPLSGGSRYRFGRQQTDVRPGQAMLLTAGNEFTRQSTPGTMVAVQIKRTAWLAEMRARRLALSPLAMSAPRALPIALPAGGPLRAALTALLEASLDTVPDLRQRSACEAALVAELVGALAAESSSRGVPSHLAAKRIADLEDWIEAHLDEPITLGRLCQVAGVGQRTLQQAFAAKRGLSPMRFVMERRLAVARQRIERAAANETIAHVALAVGFPHLGRFAVQYREAFGESPSVTLRRAAA